MKNWNPSLKNKTSSPSFGWGTHTWSHRYIKAKWQPLALTLAYSTNIIWMRINLVSRKKYSFSGKKEHHWSSNCWQEKNASRTQNWLRYQSNCTWTWPKNTPPINRKYGTTLSPNSHPRNAISIFGKFDTWLRELMFQLLVLSLTPWKPQPKDGDLISLRNMHKNKPTTRSRKW